MSFSCIISCRCRIIFISYRDSAIRRFNSCNFIFQLFNVYCICISFTSFNACDFLIASIDAIFLNRWTTIDSQTIVVNFSIANFYGTIFSKINVFRQLNFQFTIVVVYANVVISQFSFISTTNDIYYVVKMFLNNFSWISLTVVTSELHAIIVSCNFMCVAIFVFVYDTSQFITRLAINTRNTIFNGNLSTCAIFTVSTLRTSQADRAIFTVEYNRCAVFTVNTDLTINAVFTIFTNNYAVSFKVFIKFNVDSCVTICILTNDSLNVFTAVFSISFSAFALNFYSGTKFISFHTARVSVEFQAFFNQCVSCIFKICYINCTVLSFVVSSCCINFI